MIKHRTAAVFALTLIIAIGFAVAAAAAEEDLDYPEKTVGASAPHFISGDTQAEANAAAGPNDWVQVSENKKEGHYVMKNYVPRGQSESNWTELVTYMNTGKPADSPAEFVDRARASLVKVCPSAQVDVLGQSDSEITYESKVAKCPQIGDQDAIVRVIYGQKNMFSITYVVKTADMPAAKRADTIKLLSEFRLHEKS